MTFSSQYGISASSDSTMIANSTASNVVEYDANENGIDSVTVFQTDRAEVRSLCRIKVMSNA